MGPGQQTRGVLPDRCTSSLEMGLWGMMDDDTIKIIQTLSSELLQGHL